MDRKMSDKEITRFMKLAGLIKESWHPDDSSHVDLDDINDEDPEDYDDISEDADYESPSGDTALMGNINELEFDEDEKED